MSNITRVQVEGFKYILSLKSVQEIGEGSIVGDGIAEIFDCMSNMFSAIPSPTMLPSPIASVT